jgi:hypothetical protein
MRIARVGLLVLVLSGVASGCRTGGLAFRADEPVAIDLPADRSTNSLPMQVSWRTTTAIASAHRAHPDAPLFAVFVDQAPMPVGKTVAWIARDDSGCKPPACPDASYLAQHGVYLTATTSVSVDAVLSATRGRETSNGQHELTVVQLDAQGRRVGEGAVSRTFFVRGGR